ncbi:ornithine cyclodeaminase [Candidatus Nomurabacteria bacterium RIFCSPLOWO2_02_40_28]|uniref:Ornithine cyclodeaminase/mu-crystallin family protein n=2 Tax=Candidatus Nomuraibacteriota TaxID=1752729 RepID=A0A837HTB2_9BACT|nr:MAG: Ornithine cyclodeaminase/mu-crystallin family protein [Candidatus Nomurabacteria bacterium GW2011_GWD2_39_12]KKR20118.1 MAG: Ornithine cyclodeaminase/mu-crystallin family protein [Candidatus Nomurabacteria bacterium GW2011_GWC2_39_41]KKR36635.1 MAG: Ornithine cyclodeaminase/mu-crystallin family protein [Candidatus Nomurabacteria bacterium GW2011_GWE2_40_10]KKR38054.1 MAG: Ornithine cyclodeaminase/mu-crystallin family protein [Candidatus Nomurabacteria bacterium GW2011_GWB1_40_11]KKR3953
MKIITEEILAELIKRHGFENYLKDLMQQLKNDFTRWQEFNKIPRPCMQVPNGVEELMPICDDKYFTFKYVNLHPKNPHLGLMTIVATGQLARIDTGYPLMFSEMTVQTALRTAATTALATDLMSRKNSHILAMVGTGAQSEFLVKGICLVREITEVRYFDIDSSAMDKFEKNMKGSRFKLVRCQDTEEAVRGADIITTCTACKAHVDVVKDKWVVSGVHINAIGGDSVGKTELELPILSRSRIVVEYLDQSVAEGEIQRWSEKEAREKVYAELHELITAAKTARENEQQITLYDSVGMALEDYSVLRFTYELSERYNLGQDMNLTPVLADPKNLISLLQ